MGEVYITGHRNPDMDSVCSAWCYARLKNAIDPDNIYLPVRCGHMNENTKAQFAQLGIVPPPFMKDVRPKVASVVSHATWEMAPDDPVYELVTLYSQHRPSVVPIVDRGVYQGLLSVDDINSYFLKENAENRPVYHFLVENFPKVLHGRFLKRGMSTDFSAALMVGAMPFQIFKEHIEALGGHKPILVVGNRKDHIKFAVENQFPAIILTGLKPGAMPEVDFSQFHGTVFMSEEDTAETLRLLRMTLPLRHLLGETPPSVQLDMLFDDAKRLLSDSEFRGLPVYDGDSWVGFVTRRCFLERPRTKVIMVDHNELSQSIPGLEDADVVEIIDHHRLGTVKTRDPIFIASEPLGSTCTIVYHLYQRWQVPVDEQTARLLLSGIISDTVILKSPTTTGDDRAVVQDLCELAGIPDLQEFGEALFRAGASLCDQDPRKLIEADFKQYKEFGVKFGIGQCEVTTLSDVDEVKASFIKTLEEICVSYALDWALFLITDVVKEGSVLLCTPFPRSEGKLAYTRESEGKYLLPGVLSRKKQLLPEILRVLEE
ncbi:MAG: putative manganese-dependent inorganic diphosphatase [Sphaerochaetaceae bacterium]